MEPTKFVSKDQFGFREGMNTEYALLHFMTIIKWFQFI